MFFRFSPRSTLPTSPAGDSSALRRRLRRAAVVAGVCGLVLGCNLITGVGNLTFTSDGGASSDGGSVGLLPDGGSLPPSGTLLVASSNLLVWGMTSDGYAVYLDNSSDYLSAIGVEQPDGGPLSSANGPVFHRRGGPEHDVRPGGARRVLLAGLGARRRPVARRPAQRVELGSERPDDNLRIPPPSPPTSRTSTSRSRRARTARMSPSSPTSTRPASAGRSTSRIPRRGSRRSWSAPSTWLTTCASPRSSSAAST